MGFRNNSPAVFPEAVTSPQDLRQTGHSVRLRVPQCPLRHNFNAEPNESQERILPEWMDLKTAQNYVSVSDRTLRDWIRREHDPLPAVQDGGKIFISRSMLDQWMLSHRILPESAQEVGTIVDQVMSSLAEVN